LLQQFAMCRSMSRAGPLVKAREVLDIGGGRKNARTAFPVARRGTQWRRPAARDHVTFDTAQPLRANPSPSLQSLRALDAVNFLVAGLLAGFGPFLAVYLGDQGWSQERIGLVLSTGAMAGLLAQLPGGELLDLVRSKRALVALGTVIIGVGAVMIALWSKFATVSLALPLQGITGGFLLEAIEDGLTHHAMEEVQREVQS